MGMLSGAPMPWDLECLRTRRNVQPQAQRIVAMKMVNTILLASVSSVVGSREERG